MDDFGTVLLVENNGELRDATRDLLVALGHTVLAASTGEEALALFADPAARIGLVVSDLILPDSSGLELADRLLEGSGNLAIVLLSSPRHEIFLHHRRKRGDVQFLPKPFSPEELRTSLEEAQSLGKDSPTHRLQRPVPTPKRGAPKKRVGRTSGRWKTHRPSRRRRAGVWSLVAAAALVVVAGAVMQTTNPPPPLPEVGEGTVHRGTAVDLLWPMGDLDTPPAEMRFQEVEGALSYLLRIQEPDNTVLWQDRIDAPPAEVPLALQAKLRTAVVYSWNVEALDIEGRRLASSAPAQFRVRPTVSVPARPEE